MRSKVRLKHLAKKISVFSIKISSTTFTLPFKRYLAGFSSPLFLINPLFLPVNFVFISRSHLKTICFQYYVMLGEYRDCYISCQSINSFTTFSCYPINRIYRLSCLTSCLAPKVTMIRRSFVSRSRY